ncbi:hypothetical protein [Arthrobacter woluwensis]|uniref:hypothetical protein n=1 Tax=Arthrobacter woluwensis TaxID=156980 RepID=UPI001AAEA300|nr:hypothetical protein [Arthrobacter woluwensis]QTF71144.1 hypothetical protein G8758_03340 [Arthrobacter woluwensis]
MSLIIPVAIAAISAIVRAFTARTRVLKDCGDDVAAVRDFVLTVNVRPALAAVIIRIRPYVDFNKKRFLAGEPGDPVIEIQRVLGVNPTFANDYADLESHYSEIHRAQSVHDRRVAHAVRIGWAAFAFLLAWVYFGFWLCMPSVDFPVFATVCALIVGAGSLGWIGAEALGSVRERDILSELTRKARNSEGSTR